MKALIMVAALVAASAHAETVAWTPSQDGDLIKFTDEPCEEGGYVAALVDVSGAVQGYGCWKADKPTLDVLWDDTGDTFYYNLTNVILTAAGRRLLELQH